MIRRVLLFLGPQPPAPGLIYCFTAPAPNYFFTAPNDGITFLRLVMSSLTPLNKTQPTPCSKIPFCKMSYHTPIKCSAKRLAVFFT